MKKLVSLVLALVLVMALSITVFAAQSPLNSQGAGNYQIEVTGKYTEGGAADDMICVDISWGAMDFTYVAGKKEWNPSTHEAVDTEGGWTSTTNTVTVRNHSNVSVTATFAFAAANDVTGVTGSAGAITLDAAAGNVVDEDSTTLTLSGKPTAGVSGTSAKIGTLTVTIAKTPADPV